MYWLTVVGNLYVVFIVLLALSVVGSIFGFLIIDDISSKDKKDEHFKKLWYTCGIVALLSALGLVFVPNTKQLYAIYGMGSVIDYVKSDDTVKQLPHRAIVAFEKYLDTTQGENTDKKQEEK